MDQKPSRSVGIYFYLTCFSNGYDRKFCCNVVLHGIYFSSMAQTPFSFYFPVYTGRKWPGIMRILKDFLAATAAAQGCKLLCTKNYVFRSNAAFAQAVPRYVCLAVILVIVSAALRTHSQAFSVIWALFPQVLIPTFDNGVNIVVQVAMSYPAMKFWSCQVQKVLDFLTADMTASISWIFCRVGQSRFCKNCSTASAWA